MRLIKFKLWKEKQTLSPNRQFYRSLGRQLGHLWDETYPECNVWYRSRVFKYSMVAMLAVVCLGSSGVGVYAYSSPEVTDGTTLYPIKQAIEKIERRTKRSPEAVAKFNLKQIKRRELEKNVLEKKPGREVQLQKLEDRISKNEEDLEKLNKELTTSTLKDQVQERITKKAEKLKEKIEKQQEKRLEIKQKKFN